MLQCPNCYSTSLFYIWDDYKCEWVEVKGWEDTAHFDLTTDVECGKCSFTADLQTFEQQER